MFQTLRDEEPYRTTHRSNVHMKQDKRHSAALVHAARGQPSNISVEHSKRCEIIVSSTQSDNFQSLHIDIVSNIFDLRRPSSKFDLICGTANSLRVSRASHLTPRRGLPVLCSKAQRLDRAPPCRHPMPRKKSLWTSYRECSLQHVPP